MHNVVWLLEQHKLLTTTLNVDQYESTSCDYRLSQSYCQIMVWVLISWLGHVTTQFKPMGMMGKGVMTNHMTCVFPDYLDNMYCYQEVLQNKTFDKCTGAWDDVFVKLENVTSYQFYCLPQHHSTLGLSR